VRYGYWVINITGSSMVPTFNPDIKTSPLHNDVVLLERWSPIINNIQREDVVAFWHPEHTNSLAVKRVVAVAGDMVRPLPPSSSESIKVPEGHVWVMGDSAYSVDSNTYGSVSLKRTHGDCEH
jgi:inner membrane protease subunit 2